MSDFGQGRVQSPYWAVSMEARLDRKLQQILDAVQTQKKELEPFFRNHTLVIVQEP